MRTKIATVRAECGDCKGTGIYIGYDEHDGASVVCANCDGSGYREIKYKPWDGKRKRHPRAKVVYRANPGFTISTKQPGGIPYADWVKGKKFPKVGGEMRELVCPRWWYKMVADVQRLIPNWDPCKEKGSSFYDCKMWKKKDECWQRFDIEFVQIKTS